MFVCSVRGSTLKFLGLILLTLVVLVSVLAFGEENTVYASLNGMEIDYGGMKTAEDRVAFIEKFGIKVNPAHVSEESFALPEDFDRIIAGYNEIQKAQGLDLAKYRKKKVTHYKYEVTNYDSEGKVYVNLLIYKNRVVGCDISSADPSGFVLPLTEIDTAKLKND